MNNEYLSPAVVAITLSVTASHAVPVVGATADRSLCRVFRRAHDDTYKLTRHRLLQLQNRKRIDHPESVANIILNPIIEVESGA